MFKGFNVTLDSSDFINISSNSTYKERLYDNKKKIQASLKNFILTDGSIDGEKLKQEWFPNIKRNHVFISHSHKDIKLAESLASWLYDNFQINSFIDSHIWGYANDLLRELDNEYALHSSGISYSYDIRNETTSHVHMMLSSALNEVIDSTECLLFLNTSNAINNSALSKGTDDQRTASPWIMSELVTSNIIEKKQNINRTKIFASNESFIKSMDDKEFRQLTIQHKVPVDHLIKLTFKNLMDWDSKNTRNYLEYNALTILYTAFGNEMFDLSTPVTSDLEMAQ